MPGVFTIEVTRPFRIRRTIYRFGLFRTVRWFAYAKGDIVKFASFDEFARTRNAIWRAGGDFWVQGRI